ALRAHRSGVTCNAREKIVRYAGRDAAARDDKFWPLWKCHEFFENRLPLHTVQLRSGQDKAILLAGGFLVGRKVLARLDVRWRHDTVDPLTLHEPVKELPDGAAGRENRRHASAEAVSDPGYIDTAASRVTFRRRAAHFPCRLDTTDIDENVYGGVDRERDDIGHCGASSGWFASFVSQTGPLPNEIGIFWLRCHAADFRKLCVTAMQARRSTISSR